jgi:hypothetical protein
MDHACHCTATASHMSLPAGSGPTASACTAAAWPPRGPWMRASSRVMHGLRIVECAACGVLARNLKVPGGCCRRIASSTALAAVRARLLSEAKQQASRRQRPRPPLGRAQAPSRTLCGWAMRTLSCLLPDVRRLGGSAMTGLTGMAGAAIRIRHDLGGVPASLPLAVASASSLATAQRGLGRAQARRAAQRAPTAPASGLDA